MKITFNGPEKPAERKIVGWRSKVWNDYVYLLIGTNGYFAFGSRKGTMYFNKFGQSGFNDRDYDPIYEGEFSVTITA